MFCSIGTSIIGGGPVSLEGCTGAALYLEMDTAFGVSGLPEKISTVRRESIVVAPAILAIGVKDPCKIRNIGDPRRNIVQVSSRSIDAMCSGVWVVHIQIDGRKRVSAMIFNAFALCEKLDFSSSCISENVRPFPPFGMNMGS